MSNLDVAPVEQNCHWRGQAQPMTRLLPARDVPLGGIRAMSVRRSLPQRELPLVGAWCFLDQMGPERVDMRVLPHPHIGLQTVTWPLVGQVRHRDSLGSDAVISPGQLNLMTSGRGISHSEFSLGESPELHALQLWVALPDGRAGGEPGFVQYRDLPVYEQLDVTATVFVGELAGAASPAATHTALLGADVVVQAGASVTLPLNAEFEHAVLVISGAPTIAGVTVEAGPLLYLGCRRDELPIRADADARFVLLGGEPFLDPLVMWWNFVGRTHDEVVQARTDWEAHSERFGTVTSHDGQRIPAPPLPGLRLMPRRRSI